MEAKIAALLSLTARLTFHQAIVFCNSRPDGEHSSTALQHVHGFCVGGRRILSLQRAKVLQE